MAFLAAGRGDPPLSDKGPDVSIYEGITYVIPCGGEKLDHAAPAGELYTGQMFRHALTSVQRLAAKDAVPAGDWWPGREARVLVLSAKYGLVQLDQVLEPYDLRMGQPESVTVEQLAVQAQAFGIDWDEDTERGTEVYAFLPAAYLERLDAALRTLDVYVQDVYEGAVGSNGRPGIGPQRRVLSIVGRPEMPPMADSAPAGAGPIVWIGADVQGFTWGTRILVSYGRLRRVVDTLPVALAPWVLDSRGFQELGEHGTWTISAAEYAADVRRYAAEIGRLAWVAPQDWPAAAHLLAKTGLTEEEHQRRTCASVVELRALLGDVVPVVALLTGDTLAGYLRHVAMYLEHGIDVRTDPHVVAAGGLVGRKPREVAAIVEALYAAGVTRMHGLGLKTQVLDLVGPLLESIDSAQWSGEARRRGGDEHGHCPHGLVTWERNCPVFAQQWGRRQAARAVAAGAAGVQGSFSLFDLLNPTR